MAVHAAMFTVRAALSRPTRIVTGGESEELAVTGCVPIRTLQPYMLKVMIMKPPFDFS
ncbi:uncharacterized, partial [Tachysurus ichikawai]